ncbi:DUF3492 domain-containing protein [Nonomuraea ferruginea]
MPAAPPLLTDGLTAYSRCRASSFTWINHTFSHPKMNDTDYATSYAEIEDNLTIGSALGFTVDPTVLKTGEYSGLGVYHPDPDNDIDPPTDHGLAASNANLLQAAADLGVKYLHGNMSFASHRPACFNCGIRHPLKPSVMVVPDWPTNIAYHTTTAGRADAVLQLLLRPERQVPVLARRPDLQPGPRPRERRGHAARHVGIGVHAHVPPGQPAQLRRQQEPGLRLAERRDGQVRELLRRPAAHPPDWGGLAKLRRGPDRPLRRPGGRARRVRQDSRDDHVHRLGRRRGVRHQRRRGWRGHVRHRQDRPPRPGRGRPAHRQRERAPVKVTLVSEGTYPFAMGGVSVWMDQLIKGMPDYRWDVVTMTVDGAERPVWDLPPNLEQVINLPLWKGGHRRSGRPPGREFAEAYERFLQIVLTPPPSWARAARSSCPCWSRSTGTRTTAATWSARSSPTTRSASSWTRGTGTGPTASTWPTRSWPPT